MVQGSGDPPPAGESSPTPQRRWQAPCPNCGAAVPFVSAAAPVAVCSYCRSTVVRDGSSLRKIGVSAELFDDHTPLQLGASGEHALGSFTLIGRVQYAYGDDADEEQRGKNVSGTWNEWYLLFANGKDGWLSEDNDQYVLVTDIKPPPELPAPELIRVGEPLRIRGQDWQVASRVLARVRSVEGQLPEPPPSHRMLIADLRSPQGQVATLDYRDHLPRFSVGQAVRLEDLKLKGLKASPDAAQKQLGARDFSCPSCGKPVTAMRPESLSVTCPSCRSIIDLSQGVGAELRAVAQRGRGFEPKIPLGSMGPLSIGGSRKVRQVVGYSVQEGKLDGSRFTWDTYLLYNEQDGFAFLVDSEDGWIGYRTLTGVPEPFTGGAQLNGLQYYRTESYPATVKYVAGEFYWKVVQGSSIKVSDYKGVGGNDRRLSREASADEVVWSIGQRIPVTTLCNAFRLSAEQRFRMGADIKPTSYKSEESLSVGTVLAILFIVLFMVISIFQNDEEDSDTAGGSYSGYSSGGGHK